MPVSCCADTDGISSMISRCPVVFAMFGVALVAAIAGMLRADGRKMKTAPLDYQLGMVASNSEKKYDACIYLSLLRNVNTAIS